MTKYVLNLDPYGYVSTIDGEDGSTVLSLKTGSAWNEEVARQFVEQVNANAAELGKLREENEKLRREVEKRRAVAEVDPSWHEANVEDRLAKRRTIARLRSQLAAAEKERDEARACFCANCKPLASEVGDGECVMCNEFRYRELAVAAEKRAEEAEAECDELRTRLVDEHEGSPGVEEARRWEQQCHEAEGDRDDNLERAKKAEADLAAARERERAIAAALGVSGLAGEPGAVAAKAGEIAQEVRDARERIAELEKERDLAAGGPEAVQLPEPTPERTAQTNAIRRVVMEPGLVERLEAERDELRAEAERLQRSEDDALERLRNVIGCANDEMPPDDDEWSRGDELEAVSNLVAERDELRAEVARLRGDGDVIATKPTDGGEWVVAHNNVWVDGVYPTQEIAQLAPLVPPDFLAWAWPRIRERDDALKLVGKMREACRYVVESVPWKGNDASGSLGGARDICFVLIREADALLGENDEPAPRLRTSLRNCSGRKAMLEERHYTEELSNVVKNSPLFPGDTISHETARVCGKRGWIVRQADGNWIPTALGLRVHGDALLGENDEPAPRLKPDIPSELLGEEG